MKLAWMLIVLALAGCRSTQFETVVEVRAEPNSQPQAVACFKVISR